MSSDPAPLRNGFQFSADIPTYRPSQTCKRLLSATALSPLQSPQLRPAGRGGRTQPRLEPLGQQFIWKFGDRTLNASNLCIRCKGSIAGIMQGSPSVLNKVAPPTELG